MKDIDKYQDSRYDFYLASSLTFLLYIFITIFFITLLASIYFLMQDLGINYNITTYDLISIVSIILFFISINFILKIKFENKQVTEKKTFFDNFSFTIVCYFLLYGGVGLLTFLYSSLFHYDSWQKGRLIQLDVFQGMGIILAFLTLFFLTSIRAPITEEIVFRLTADNLISNNIKSGNSVLDRQLVLMKYTLIIMSFFIIHFINIQYGRPSFFADYSFWHDQIVIEVLISSFFFILVFKKTNHIIYSILLHALSNFTQVILVILDTYIVQNSILISQIDLLIAIIYLIFGLFLFKKGKKAYKLKELFLTGYTIKNTIPTIIYSIIYLLVLLMIIQLLNSLYLHIYFVLV